MAEEKKSSNSKVIIILLIIVIILLIGGGVTAFVLLSNNQNNNTISETNSPVEDDIRPPARRLEYEQGVIALDADSLQRAVDAAFAETEDGYITLDFSNEAVSEDGINFKCSLGNSPENKRDMYIGIYLDSNFDDEYYLSGLIRPGDMIQSFQGSRVLDDGVYEAVATFTQVEDDHETLSYQTSVVLTLTVDKTGR